MSSSGSSSSSSSSSSGSSSDDKKKALLISIDKLVEQTDDFLSAKYGGSPRKSKAKQRRGPARKRMTEKEEDELLLQSGVEDMKGSSQFVTRLTAQPPNIKGGTMRDYQLAGLNWMIQLYEKGLNGILADEMGLGKTLQSISLLAYLQFFRNISGPHLVAVPLSTLGNWVREFTRWCPSLRVVKFHGNKEQRKAIATEQLVPGQFDVCITSYEMIILAKSMFKKTEWHFLVVDEAHRLKNEHSTLSTVLRDVPSAHRLLLTGTPLQNNLHELWALLNFLMPKVFANSDTFDEAFTVSDSTDEEAVHDEAVKKLHKVLRPFMLRRLKSDVEKSLLPKVETLLFVGMTAMQKEVYRRVTTKNMDALHGQVKEKRRLLNIVMQLRKSANHPYLFDGVEDRTLDPYGEHVVENAGKLVLLDKLLPKLREQDSRCLIFSQMTRMLDVLEDYCNMRGFPYNRIDGGTGQESREQQMMEFNAPGSEKFIFLLSTRAGGLGINLATADIVIIYDSDWNPQMDLQAMDRAHRIGQKKQVVVYRLVTENTIEEKIIQRAEIKLRLDALVVQQGRLAAKNSKLGSQDMLEMIRYGADKVFRSTDSDVTDEDIDDIIAKGKKKTAELNDKLQKHVGMKNLSFSLNDDNTEESLISDHVNEQYNLEMVTRLAEAMPKRERRVRYNEDEVFRGLMRSKPHSVLPRPKELPKMEEWQFFPRERLQQLHQKEMAFWERNHKKAEPPAQTGLSEEEQKEVEMLLNQGFSSWRKRDFYAYRQCCADFGRDNIDSFADKIGSKSAEEVRAYHRVFWQRYQEIKDWKKQVIGYIERGEKLLKKHKELALKLKENVAPLAHSSFLDNHVINFQYMSTQKDRGFTAIEDKFLLLKTYELGYGAWGKLKAAIRDEPYFRSDFFLKSRTTTDLKRRVEMLIRLVSKNKRKTPATTGRKRKNSKAASKRVKTST